MRSYTFLLKLKILNAMDSVAVAAGEGCYVAEREGAALESLSRRSCSPEQGECRQEPSDVASEVTVLATEEPTVSSLICSGLQTINGTCSSVGGEQLPSAGHAWEESYGDVEPQQCGGAELAASEGEMCGDHVVLQHEESASQIEPYPPIPVVSL